MIYMFLSNNPSSGDINSSNLSCSVMFLLKKKFVSTPDSEQSKTLLTIDERGSKLARNSVLIAKCRLFDE